MKSRAITSNEDIVNLYSALKDIRNEAPSLYFFYYLLLNYGIKQDDIFLMSLADIKKHSLPLKYSDVQIDFSEIAFCFSKTTDPKVPFKEVLPSRDHLYKVLNKFARKNGFSYPINASILQKTWAFLSMKEGLDTSIIMSHFGYTNSIYSFLMDFLGIPSSLCICHDNICGNFLSACFREISSYNFDILSLQQRENVCDLLFDIFDIISPE